MADTTYHIGNTTASSNDGFSIPPRTLDTTHSSLGIAGKYYSEWGDVYANNFIDLTQNFAGDTNPANPRLGQLWYDTANHTLKLWDQSWGNAVVIPTSTLTATGHVTASGPLSAPINFTLSNSGVTPGNYLSANISVDQFGRITSASNGLTGNDQTTPVTSFNTRIGAITLTNGDVIAALGFTPYNSTNPANYGTPPDISGKLNKAGDTMTGALNMNGQKITALPAPTTAAEPVRLSDLQTAAAQKTQRVFNGTGETSYNVTVSPNAPSGGAEGDVWYRY